MTKFKNSDKFKLYYSDTDSIFVDKDLPKDLIGNEIGQFKLEYIFKEVVFLGPKIYGGLIDNNNFICKIKGYKNPQNITLEDLKSLLNKNSKPLELNHDKWYRNLSESNIVIKDQIYNLIATENKRKLIYDSKGIAINTKAIKI